MKKKINYLFIRYVSEWYFQSLKLIQKAKIILYINLCHIWLLHVHLQRNSICIRLIKAPLLIMWVIFILGFILWIIRWLIELFNQNEPHNKLLKPLKFFCMLVEKLIWDFSYFIEIFYLTKDKITLLDRKIFETKVIH